METLNAPLSQYSAFNIRESEDVGDVRRGVRKVCLAIGLEESAINRAELIATELATNLLYHAKAPSTIYLQPVPTPLGLGVELLSVDAGPGIANVGFALKDRSPADYEAEMDATQTRPRGMGSGLGAIVRAADQFDIFSEVGKGTVVFARVGASLTNGAELAVGGVSTAVENLSGNGDGWSARLDHGSLSTFVIDGLGHGAYAEVASKAGIKSFENEYVGDPVDALGRAHKAMRGTRGGAGSLVTVSPKDKKAWFAGVGNVNGQIYTPGVRSRGLAPRAGTLGMNDVPPRFSVEDFEWAPGSLMILYSDGLTSQVRLEPSSALCQRHPSIVAAVLHRDFFRGRDDATVVVVKDIRQAA